MIYGFVAIIAVFGSLVTASPGKVDARCPSVNGAVPVFLTHETRCNMYYVCDTKLAILMTCPHHLHFNKANNVCDQPDNAGCTLNAPAPAPAVLSAQVRSVPESKVQFAPPGKKDSRCPLKNPNMPVFLSHETNCASYYVCDTGFAILMGCPHHLVFNPDKNVCDEPANVNCATKAPQKTPAAAPAMSGPAMSGAQSKIQFSPPGKKDSRCPLKNPNMPVFLTHENSCASYYVCDTGFAILMGCPHHLVFNTDKNVCDEPANVNCARKAL